MAETVETTGGRVRGGRSEGVSVYRGIPFARQSRFAPPRPPVPWSGIQDATAFGPAAPQHAMGPRPAPASQSEDCLYLNVWTPAADAGRRPVMVWVHGGGFEAGTSFAAHTDGSALVRRGDVVVVSLAYRLGALGFLDLTGWGGPANLGLLDQVAGLEWVRDNIAAFGGDPGNVTVFGESAGAFSIGALLAMPRAKACFHKAILQSGGTTRIFQPDTTQAMTADLLRATGCATIDELRAVDADKILDAQQRVIDTDIGCRNTPGGRSWGAVADGEVLPAHPQGAVESGAVAGFPILVSATRDEVNVFRAAAPSAFDPVDEAALLAEMSGCVGGRADRLHAFYRATDPDLGSIRSRFLTDWIYRIPAVRLAEYWRGPAWLSLFAWSSPVFADGRGSHHALDTPFVFGTVADPAVAAQIGPDPSAAAVSEAMSTAWISFAHTGNPGWPRYTRERRTTMRFDAEPRPVDDPERARREIWEGVVRR